MKKEKIYEFAIDRPLTPARRQAVEKHIEHNAGSFAKSVSYNWDEDDDEVLHIEAKPVLIEIKFQDKSVELYGAAPLWARLLFTKQKKAELKEQIQSVLQEAKFVVVRNSRKPTVNIKKRALNGRNVAGTTRRKRSTV